MRILQNDAERAAQVRLLYLLYVYPVVPYFAVLYIVKTVYEVRYRRFARARRADERYLLARPRVQTYIVQYGLFGLVSEVNVLENYISAQARLCDRAVRGMRVLPRPYTRSLFTFRKIAVLVLLCVDERHVALVLLDRFVKQSEYPLRAGERHNDRVQLL